MTMNDETFQHMILDRFHYNDRTDDGYGPDSPRVGDRGDVVRSPYTRIPFTIGIEPRTGLPALHIPKTPWTGEEHWRSLLNEALDPHAELILHERAHGTARITTYEGDEYPTITLSPPYEGCETVIWEHGRLRDPETYMPVDDDDSWTVEEALIRLGYEPVTDGEDAE
ncbi:hypothetical protein [Bifidobacterium felsineum]|uniref:hypothetical protein n=1 Tax=Bifidobacterium felsineum TaxID=2045440 RepID=UPI001BDC61F0|nr:hypothetical protein [Bifidobacterium felsineum]MBT1164643.1 hypothetical protein [Bifidobacterium felsineum]